jgi:hypothetical protein
MYYCNIKTTPHKKRTNLYLDYYPAVRNPKTMQLSRREYLGFYIYATPKNAIELDYNNEILAKAELIRCPGKRP